MESITFRDRLPEDRVPSEAASIDIAAMFKALGDPTRLRIFEFLRQCSGPVALEESGDVRPVLGPTVGEICCHITGEERVSSAISFHLKELRLAGLVNVERRGKNMICSIRQENVDRLARFVAGNGSNEVGVCC